jgi:hypothetical protein
MSTGIDQAAAEVLALINSKPRTPTNEELVAVLAAHLEKPAHDAPSALRSEWDALMAACRAADAGAEDEAGGAAVLATGERADEYVERIVKAPVRGLADIKLLAEALHWRLWSDPAGITDASLAEGPGNEVDAEADKVLAALLKGIRDFRDVPHVASPRAGACRVPSAKPTETETWAFRSIGAWRYLEAEWERYEFVTRVAATVAPGDPQARAVDVTTEF